MTKSYMVFAIYLGFMVVLLMSCSEKTPPSPKAATIADTPLNNKIRAEITAIGIMQFPDNPNNTWTVKAIEERDQIIYVLAEPDPKDVGYDLFVFALTYAEEKPVCKGVYTLIEGEYKLLMASGELPKVFTFSK